MNEGKSSKAFSSFFAKFFMIFQCSTALSVGKILVKNEEKPNSGLIHWNICYILNFRNHHICLLEITSQHYLSGSNIKSTMKLFFLVTKVSNFPRISKRPAWKSWGGCIECLSTYTFTILIELSSWTTWMLKPMATPCSNIFTILLWNFNSWMKKNWNL